MRQTFSIESLVSSSATINCGPIVLEFFNADGARTQLDSTLFKDERYNSGIGALVILKSDDEDLKVGEYPILYRLFLENYSEVSV